MKKDVYYVIKHIIIFYIIIGEVDSKKNTEKYTKFKEKVSYAFFVIKALKK